MKHFIKKLWVKSGKNHIYCMWSPLSFWAVKIGVSNAPELRRNQVNESVAAKLGYDPKLWVFAFPVLSWAYQFEKTIHKMHPFKILRFPFFRGTDGHTEWFLCINPVCSILYLISCYAISAPMGVCSWGLMLIFPLFPLDALLIVMLVFMLQWSALLAGLFILYNIFF